ncbi:MAG: hypothetical protein WCT99_04385 [Bacteroidota bacterium]|jgi:hypothetical protein
MKIFPLLLLTIGLFWQLNASPKPEMWTVTVNDFSINSQSGLLQRDAVFFTEYVALLLKQKTGMNVRSRFDIGTLIADPTVSQNSLMREIGKRTNANVVLTASIKKNKEGGKYNFTFLFVSTETDEDDYFEFDYFPDNEQNIENQFTGFVREAVEIIGDLIEGRSILAPPNFRHLGVGIDLFGVVGGNIKDVVNYNNPSILTRHQIMGGSFSFRLSPHVFAMFSGLSLSATDKIITAESVFDPSSPDYFTIISSFFGSSPEGVRYFDRVTSEANRNGTFVRKDVASYYVGGGIGLRFWRIRIGGQYLVPTSAVNKKERNSDLFPKNIIIGNADIYLIANTFVGLNYIFSNSIGVIDNNIDRIYPNGLPDIIDNNEIGIKRRVMSILTFRFGIEI